MRRGEKTFTQGEQQVRVRGPSVRREVVTPLGELKEDPLSWNLVGSTPSNQACNVRAGSIPQCLVGHV